MSFWKKLFRGGSTSPIEKSQQLPSAVVAKEFGEVNVRRIGDEVEVLFTILMEPIGAEGWQTGVALDGSGSMAAAYGKGLIEGPAGPLPNDRIESYQRQGWLQVLDDQGTKFPVLSAEGAADLAAGESPNLSKNEVETHARQLTAYLASNLDADGGTTVIYWACGNGEQIEVVGDFTAEQCENARFAGPGAAGFGRGTHLTPALRYFAERFTTAKNGIYLFVTDGELNDLADVKRYTIQLCQDIQAKRRNPLKCVLIGVGEKINERQMEELDDLDSGTGIDIWDHKIAREMRQLVEIFAEIVTENQIVAPTARIFSEHGEVVRDFPDGLPGRVSFRMSARSPWFELEVAGRRIRQSVTATR